MNIGEQLLYVTARIESSVEDSVAQGTGFFFNYDFGQSSIPVLVTNRHMVQNVSELTVRYCYYSESSPNNRLASLHRMTLSNQTVIMHPNPQIDLCVIPFGAIFNQDCSDSSIHPFCFSEKDIPSLQQTQSLQPIEEVTMIGYPSGLYDEAHESPLFRKGITATPLKYDYNDQPVFLADMACYPGSSGSPIVIFNQGAYATNEGISLGSRLFLVGIQSAMVIREADGVIKLIDMPTSVQPVFIPQGSINLGIAIHAKCLFDFRPQIQQLITT